jgi:hypothetical protein
MWHVFRAMSPAACMRFGRRRARSHPNIGKALVRAKPFKRFNRGLFFLNRLIV